MPGNEVVGFALTPSNSACRCPHPGASSSLQGEFRVLEPDYREPDEVQSILRVAGHYAQDVVDKAFLGNMVGNEYRVRHGPACSPRILEACKALGKSSKRIYARLEAHGIFTVAQPFIALSYDAATI